MLHVEEVCCLFFLDGNNMFVDTYIDVFNKKKIRSFTKIVLQCALNFMVLWVKQKTKNPQKPQQKKNNNNKKKNNNKQQTNKNSTEIT
jgi:hypothetical protein